MINRSTLRRWGRYSEVIERTDVARVERIRQEARALGARIDDVIQKTDARLRAAKRLQASPRRPMHADWIWRPAIWTDPLRPVGVAGLTSGTTLGSEAKVFHDCPRAEVSVRQVKPGRPDDSAFGLQLEVFGFDGTFLSLAIDLPDAALSDLSRRHVIALDCALTAEAPIPIFGRLNVRHGPNTEQIVREVEQWDGTHKVEFDLAASHLDEARVQSAWVDIIFEYPGMNRIMLRDLSLSRRPRAEV